MQVKSSVLPMANDPPSPSPSTIAGYDGRSTPAGILKPPAYATVDDDLEVAMPRQSRAVSFSERTKRSLSPPASHQSLYDLVRPPTPIPQDPRAHQPEAPSQQHTWSRVGLVSFLVVEAMALGIVVYAARNKRAWTCDNPWIILPVVFLGSQACVRSIAFVVRRLEFAAWGLASGCAKSAWDDVMDVLIPILAVVLATIIFYAMSAEETCGWSF